MKPTLFLSIIYVISAVFPQDLPPSCPSAVYCYGKLLHTVQLAHIYNDSKTFVDLKMKQLEKQTLENFATFMKKNNDTPTKEQIEQFVNDNFEAGNELEDWTPSDYTPNPKFLSRIDFPPIKNFSAALVKLWPVLSRQVKLDVTDNAGLYSFIPVPNGFIIPGGRFSEYYYWDSYWIIKGLLISEMMQTARGMIDNFLYLVNLYGFVPNGGRVYYLERSQPPLLTSMAYAYYQTTKDKKWLSQNIKTLETELNYWSKQTTTVRGYKLAHYDAESSGPRPESYREDIATAANLDDEKQREQLYIDLKSGAESGWDFSTRWIFDAKGGTAGNLSDIQTRRVLPVDLNSYLCRAYGEIAELFNAIGKPLSGLGWTFKRNSMQEAIQTVFWNKQDKMYYDYDLKLRQHRRYFFPSNLAPLWANCLPLFGASTTGKHAVNYLKNKGILDYQGGVPTSTEQSGQQWDFPNAWPPLQDIIVTGLENTGNADAKEAAKSLANRWVYSNMLGFEKSGQMFEKYDAVTPGEIGGGGEYPPQAGFGWSNGVALEFITKYFSS